jgi:hypothetical protein
MISLAFALLLSPVHAADLSDSFSENGCRAGYSNASFKRINVHSGMHATQEGDSPNTTTVVMVITDAKTVDDARGKDKIYLQATLPTSAQNLQSLNTLATQIEKGQISNLCLKSTQDWIDLDSSFSLRYGVEPNTYQIDAKQPLPRN